MEAFQPFLIVLLALNLALFGPLLVRTVRSRLGRRRDAEDIDAATPLMLARLRAIMGGPSAEAEPTSETPVAALTAAAVSEAPAPALDAPAPAAAVAVAAATEAPAPVVVAAATEVPAPVAVAAATAPAPAAALVPATASFVTAAPRLPVDPGAIASRRRVWRDASAALVVLAGISLLVVVALPVLAQPAPEPTPAATELAALPAEPTAVETSSPRAIAMAPSPLPTRLDIVLPTAVPTPTLPVTETPKPKAQATARPRVAATPKPTPKPTAKPPKATPKPTPRPTPVPPPRAGFTWDANGLAVDFTNTSKTYGAGADWHWDFGDGRSSTAKNPDHTYGGGGCYVVELRVTTKGGRDSAFKQVCID